MKNKNLIVKLTELLIISSLVVGSMSGCTNNNSKYVVTNENDTMVLHKAKETLITERHTIDCGVEKVKIEASYNNKPQEYAYDVKCEECFPD